MILLVSSMDFPLPCYRLLGHGDKQQYSNLTYPKVLELMDPETLTSHNIPLVLTRDNLAIRKAFPSVQKQQPPKCVCRVSQKAINNASFIVLSPIEPAITDKPCGSAIAHGGTARSLHQVKRIGKDQQRHQGEQPWNG